MPFSFIFTEISAVFPPFCTHHLSTDWGLAFSRFQRGESMLTSPAAEINRLLHLRARVLQEFYATGEEASIPNAFFTKSQLAVIGAEA